MILFSPFFIFLLKHLLKELKLKRIIQKKIKNKRIYQTVQLYLYYKDNVFTKDEQLLEKDEETNEVNEEEEEDELEVDEDNNDKDKIFEKKEFMID